MHSIGIDVGSGITQWASGSKRGSFPSLAAIWDVASMSGTLENPWLVKVGSIGTTYLVGPKVPLVTRDVADSLTDEWAGSDPWLALLYAAVYDAGLLPSKDPISVAIGVPQALYRAVNKGLVERLSGVHRFSVYGVEYLLDMKVGVYPQASAAMAAVDELSDSEIVGLIDVGTYTTGLSVMQLVSGEPVINHTMCGGISRGTSVLARHVQSYLDTHHQTRMDLDRVYPLLDRRVVKIKGREIDLRHAVDSACLSLSSEIEEAADRVFRGGSEMEVIALVGGGGKYVLPRLDKVFPQLFMPESSEWSVVMGLSAFAAAHA